MAERSRLEELERRVKNDPASIAFAQLAEEYRRAGRLDDAVRVCRDGLRQHPAYLSARVTLGRALVALGEYREARTELEHVVRAAPDNLSAIRTLADLHQQAGDIPEAELPRPMPVVPVPPADLDLALPHKDEELTRALHAIDALDLRDLGGQARTASDHFEPSELDLPEALLAADFVDGLSSFDPAMTLESWDALEAREELVEPTPERLTMWKPSVPAEPPSRHELDGTMHLLDLPPVTEEPVLATLESWLDAIVTDRASRS